MYLLSRLVFCVFFCSALAFGEGLEDRFQSPPHEAKPHTWWHWMGGHVSKEGITEDLEAMAAIGLGGFQMFQVSIDTPLGEVAYDSPLWHEMIKHAMAESDRLGLEFGFNNCAGWSSSGGPWITPEMSMKQVVWSETQVRADAIAAADGIALPEPEHRLGYYRDIAVIAFPTPEQERRAGEPFRLDNWEQKGFHFPHAVLTITPSRLHRDTRRAPEEAVVRGDEIRVLEAEFDGSTFRIPAGALAGATHWTLMRFGYTTTGVTNSPAVGDGEGLEIDKMDRAALDAHWDHLIDRIVEHGGSHPGTFTNVLIDSFEKDYQNWTGAMTEEFETRRAYSLSPWMVALSGRIVNSVDQTERFLWDFRQTIGELINENYFRYFREKAHENGLYSAVEPYGMGTFDEFGAALETDLPMAEFWTRLDMPEQKDTTTKLASSAANIAGRRLVGAEAFTSVFETVWTNHPRTLKPSADFHMAGGVNRMIFHTYVHQPWGDAITPGMNMGRFGLNFNRNNTWFSKAGPFIDYLTRTQQMIQEGKESVDLLYVYAANTPAQSESREEIRPAVPVGYSYNKTGHQVLKEASVDAEGYVRFASGARFRVLIMTDAERMRVETAAELLRLAEAGARVLVDRPLATPGLEDYPEADRRLSALMDRLQRLDGVAPTAELQAVLERIGLKRDFDDGVGGELPFYHGYAEGVDWYFVANTQDRYRTIHATFRVGGRVPELWDPETGGTGPAPIWHFTGDGRCSVQLDFEPGQSLFVVFRRPYDSRNDRQIVLARFVPQADASRDRPAGSPAGGAAANGEVAYRFLEGRPAALVREPGTVKVEMPDGRTCAFDAEAPVQSVEARGPWTVRFGGFGPEEPITLDRLMAWNTHPDERIRYFSGTARYRTTFDFSARDRGGPIELDLGTVHEIAEVFVNGESAGTLWRAPFRVDIAPYVRDGTNTLEIEVTNLQVNRIIGDEQQPGNAVEWLDETEHPLRIEGSLKSIPEWVEANRSNPVDGRETFFTFRFWDADDPLLDSGLLGPVRIVVPEVGFLAE